MIKSPLFALLLLLGGSLLPLGQARCQSIFPLQGRILAADTGEPVPYAGLRLEGTHQGAVANADGAFSLPVKERDGQVLRISAMGYAPLRVPLAAFVAGEELPITLQPQPYTLAQVYIFATDLEAKDMVRLALERVPRHFGQAPFRLQAFYRHYCEEGGEYGRLIEAAVDLYDRKGYRRPVRRPGRKMGVAVRQLRRSFDFTRLSAYRHLPMALYPTLEADLAAFDRPLRTDFEAFTFTFTDTTAYEGQPVYRIFALGQVNGATYRYDLFLGMPDFVLLKVREEREINRRWERQRFHREDVLEVSYQRLGSRYYPRYYRNEGSFVQQYLDSAGQVIEARDHAHKVALMVNAVDTVVTHLVKGEPEAEELAQIAYEPRFWDQYAVLQATPLEQAIERDLAARVPLETQFREFGQALPAALQDDLAARRLAQLLAEQEGPVLLCVWNSDYRPGLRELLVARKLAKQYEGELPVSIVLISTDAEPERWQRSIEQKKLYLGTHLRVGSGLQAPVLRTYGIEAVPYILLLDGAREVAYAGSRLPKAQVILDLLERMKP